ncbi:M24 family metallopeptidase [Limosilactobacillus caecicola]|uniref:M24 family metallopeptidase n=1 Tax=Limosilactobacillus caecicola TaxID=2941332 RepID=UPI0020417931|nr:aminopeptidase P family protein [Limosilactobacillus caecicola]
MASRIERLRRRFKDMYIDAFLVTNGDNIKYLTGFSLPTGDGLLLVTEQQSVLITDQRYQLALEELDSNEVVGLLTGDYYQSLNELCQGLQVTVMGFEDTLTYHDYDLLDEIMVADLVPFENVIGGMRAVKDQQEIAALERSATLMSKGYQYVLENVHVGMTERTVANQLDFWMKEHGASGGSFSTIVASGVNAAKPHATASDKVIADGDIVILDFGYFVNGYTADMTRTFAMGSIDPELRDVYQIVNNARQAVIEHAKAGINGATLDQVGRSLIEEAGYDDEFNHGMGHGIGLAVHELPATYGPATKNVHLQANQVITVEPGIYIPELGGVRIEDDVVVTHGEPQVITIASTDLQIID